MLLRHDPVEDRHCAIEIAHQQEVGFVPSRDVVVDFPGEGESLD
jgi:hypothetical protein